MYQLRITLDKITPPIWRILKVPETFSLNKLHHIIQIAFGWTNSHMYMFGAWENKIGDQVTWDDGETKWDKKIRIRDVLAKPGDAFPYEYDLGDSWKHTIILERIVVAGPKTLKCIYGERAAPPEDCGGVPGYQELLHHIHHPEKDGYLELLEWVGEEYDPEHFDLEGVNKRLRNLNSYIRRFEERNEL